MTIDFKKVVIQIAYIFSAVASALALFGIAYIILVYFS